MNDHRKTRLSLTLIPAFVLLAVFILTNLLSGSATVLAQRSATRTPTRTPTSTPTRRPTATRTPLTASLKKQLYWGGLGGYGDNWYCTREVLDPLKGRAGIITAERIDLSPTVLHAKPLEFVPLCVSGLPFDEGVGIELYRPDGRSGGTGEYYLGEENLDINGWDLQPVDPQRNEKKALVAYVDGLPVIQFLLWAPDGLPQGEWYASLQAGAQSYAGSFNLPPWKTAPMVAVDNPPRYRFPNAFPLGKASSDYLLGETGAGILTTGNKILLYGAGFPPGSLTGIGAYKPGPDAYSHLVNQLQVRANARGEWSVVYILGKNDPPGSYDLVIVLDPTSESGNYAGPSVLYAIEEWRPCPNTYASLLQAGQRAQVIPGQKANRLRSSPSTSANNEIGLIPAGQPFDILDGPRCAEGWVWWYVSAPNGQTGWTSEGDARQRWLELAPE